MLEAIFEGAGADLGAAVALDPEDESTRRVGGPTEHVGDEDVHLRVLLDGSALEVYIGSGEVLSTRIYRCEGLMWVAVATVIRWLRVRRSKRGATRLSV